jgi:hypothetical protein
MNRRRRTAPARPFDDDPLKTDERNEQVIWASEAIVTGGDSADECVQFDEVDGMPMVKVTLEPSKHIVMARVGATIAGAGEGEWTPFIVGDHVLVTFPNGSLRRGIITSRLNNALDGFPFTSVAGQDPRKNNFGFRRRRTPYVEEYAGPVIFRSATTGALFSIDKSGTVTIKDGENATIQLSPDTFSFQGPSTPESPPSFLMQANYEASRFHVQIGSALFSIEGGSNGKANIVSPGTMNVTTGISAAIEHVATIEFVLAMLGLMAQTITPVGGGDPSTGGVIGTALAAAVAAGGAPLTPAMATALATGLQIASTVPKLPSPLGVQALPGLGAVNFLVG